MRLLLCATAVLVAGCYSETPPRSITLVPDAPEVVRVATERARQAWCDAPVGWCPTLVAEGGEAEVVVQHFTGEATADDQLGWRALHRVGGIDVSPYVMHWTADELTGILLHEFGHFGIEGHVPSSALMHAVFAVSALSVPHVVDTQAAMAWCRAQGC